MSNNLGFSSSWEPSDSQQQDHVTAQPPTAHNQEYRYSQLQPQPQAYAHSTLSWRLPATRPVNPSSGGDPCTSSIHHNTINATPTMPGESASAAENMAKVQTGSGFMYRTQMGSNCATSKVMHATTKKSARGEFDWSSVKLLMLNHDENLCEQGDKNSNNNNGNGRATAWGPQQQMNGSVDSQEERQDKRHRRTMNMLHEVEKTLRKLQDGKKQQQNSLEHEMMAVKNEIILLRQSIGRMNELLDENENSGHDNKSNNKNANAIHNRNMSFGVYIDTVNTEATKILEKCKIIDDIECDRQRQIERENMQKRKCEELDERKQQTSQQQQQQHLPVYLNVRIKKDNEVGPMKFLGQTQGNYPDDVDHESSPSPPAMPRRHGVVMQEDMLPIGESDVDEENENESQHRLHVGTGIRNRENINETEDDDDRYTQFLNASFSLNGSSTESSDFFC